MMIERAGKKTHLTKCLDANGKLVEYKLCTSDPDKEKAIADNPKFTYISSGKDWWFDGKHQVSNEITHFFR